jgi:hypothetical protein
LLTGKIGVRSYDEYPTLAGFFMVWHKYGVFVSFVLNAVAAAAPVTIDNLLDLNQCRLSPLCAAVVAQLEALPKHIKVRWLNNTPQAADRASTVVVVVAMFYATALAGHCYLLAFFTPELALEESVVYSLLWGSMAAILYVLILVSRRLKPTLPIPQLLDKHDAFD